MAGDALAAAYAHCEAHVRSEDRDAWLATLFAPAGHRPYLLTLACFAREIGRVKSRVRDAMAGEIRLQWWRDVIEGEARGDVAANPLAAALLDTIARTQLSPGALIDAIEAHRSDLYDEPMQDLAALETFCDRTRAGFIRLAAAVLAGPEADVSAPAHHAGVAEGLAATLHALPWRSREGGPALPGDLVAAEDGIAAAAQVLRRRARDHLAALRAARRTIPEAAGPAFLTANLIEPFLKAQERLADPLETPVEIPAWRRQWILWRAARAGGVR